VVLPFRYVEQVEAAGATAVVLPPAATSDAEVLDRLDAVVFAGGADLDPRCTTSPRTSRRPGCGRTATPPRCR
jgi:putative glutamine amidotransferase